MKKLEIIIRPSMFDKVKDALTDMGIHGLNYVEIKGFGRQRGPTEVYRGTTMQVTACGGSSAAAACSKLF